jgi:hypothetical protein
MPLHIFLGDEELLYFIVRVEVTKIQIWFEYKLVCNLQKGLKIYKGFSIFPSLKCRNLLATHPASSRARPDRPSKPARAAQPAQRARTRLTQPDPTR